MKHLAVLNVVTVLLATMLSPTWAAVKLNSSKSNIYRLTYPIDLMSQAKATSLLAEMDKLGRMDETQLRQQLISSGGASRQPGSGAANLLRKNGVDPDRVKKIVILFPGSARDPAVSTAVSSRVIVDDPAIWILLLTNPADEAQAISFTFGSKSK